MPSQKQAAGTPENPFNADLVAAIASPRYSSGEHRIAFSDQKNGIDGYVYGKSLDMALARAEFVVKAVNERDELLARLRSLEGRNEELGKALQEIADESQQHGEYNPLSGVTRLPKGYTKIMNMACAALTP